MNSNYRLERAKAISISTNQKKSVLIRVFTWRIRIIRVLFFLTANSAKVYAKKKGLKARKAKSMVQSTMK
ncbi:hypothetical protein [Flavobacterium lipolyticum]|uniref:Uncharacterized protein n=1 Tax=Flavobacterium lipolyticum TaxID=2893754 RepID=A0ABS8M700_9FLAO|nr:hypothetical protein [Flavobacterium sp. F-126]MCC9020594.1 hypothetical protein [Flavobacterium sp. F-126]